MKNKKLTESNAFNMSLPPYEIGQLYCVDCEKEFEYAELYTFTGDGDFVCNNCDSIRYLKKEKGEI